MMAVPVPPGGKPAPPTGSAPRARPSAVRFGLCLAVLAVTAVSFWVGAGAEVGIGSTGREADFNTVGYVAGCFASIFVLFLLLREENRRRAGLNYDDWRPVPVRALAVWVTFAAWALGGLHLWFWVLDLTRP